MPQALTMAFHRTRNLETRIIRIFNTYGPRMRVNDGRVVPNFFAQAISGKPLTIYGDGSQTRSFCYVDDLVAGILAVYQGDHSEPVNLGNPNEMTILEFANLVKEIASVDASLEYTPLPEDDPKVRQPDISKAKSLYGWEPKVSLEVGLQRAFEYFKTQVKP